MSNVIVNERVIAYINSLDTGNTGFLCELEKYATDNFIPIIRKETQNLLKFFVSLTKPAKILEAGTAIGFSAILMCQAAPKFCKITTMENYEKRIPIALDNIKKSGYEDRINLIQGDAVETMKALNDEYDLIFIDSAKGQYINMLPDAIRLLKKGGLLISDNVMQDGEIIESRYAVTRRNRTIHSRMRDYLFELTHNDKLVTSILPIGDGVTVSTKL